jgi:outer membrane protein assembly factor BamB
MSHSWQNRTERAVSVLWDVTKTFAVPVTTTQGPIYIGATLADCVQLRYQASTGKYWAFSLETGNLLWSSDGENTLNLPMRNEKVAYGMLYTAGAGGSVYAYDIHKGLNWTYNAFANASEVASGSFYWSGVALVSDGKVYVAIGEPAVGAPFMCFDAISGDLIWRADGMFARHGVDQT